MASTQNTWESFSNGEQVELTSRYLLTMAMPRLVADESAHHGTTWSDDFIEVNFRDIEPWTDFTETNLNRVFGRVLRSSTPWSKSIENAFANLDRPRIIEKEENLDEVFLENIAPVLRHSLQCTKGVLRDALGCDYVTKIRIPPVAEAVKISLPQYNNDPKHFKRPNFPIYLPAGAGVVPGTVPGQDVIFVIGESARLAVLDPECFVNSTVYRRSGRIHIAKLAMYCKHGGTSLAFTMTHLGVTVFRFFTIPNGDGTLRMGLQHMFAPWVPACFPGDVPAGQDNQLSGAKAIWGLLMASLSAEGRKLVSRDQLRPLTQWAAL